MQNNALPEAMDTANVGTYPAVVKAGGGFVWDEVLEYRVWCHPERGAEDLEDGNDYYYAFPNHTQAAEFKDDNIGSDDPIALVLQREYIDEPREGQFIHVREERITEWPVWFLSRPRRTKNSIPDFMSPDAPANRLEILRGQA